MDSRYESLGVSSSKEDIHRAISRMDRGIYPNAFCKILPDLLGQDAAYCNVMHADGAGTKSSLAYLYWKETGDQTVWKGIAQDSIVMNLDDLLCVGITGDILLSSTIGRNKFKIPGEVISELINGTEEFLEKMRSFGVSIISSGGETADIGDLVRTIVVDSSAMARIKREEIITNEKISEPGVIIGLSSFGQSVYEAAYNGGIGSNGLTSARHDILSSYYAEKYPESYDHGIKAELVYSGNFKLTDQPAGVPVNLGKLLLSPTRTYAPVMKEIFKNYRKVIHGIIHCSGGGQVKVLNFIAKARVIKNNLFEIPPLFQLIQHQCRTSLKEMYRVFNMGHRMEIYLPEKYASEIIDVASRFKVEARIIGYVEKSISESVEIRIPEGIFEYFKPVS